MMWNQTPSPSTALGSLPPSLSVPGGLTDYIYTVQQNSASLKLAGEEPWLSAEPRPERKTQVAVTLPPMTKDVFLP